MIYIIPAKKKPAGKTVYEFISEQLHLRLQQPVPEKETASELITIPVCYEKEFAPDMEHLAGEKNITMEEVIHIHTSKQYRVYMLGFLPGFSYMGEVDDKIAMPRKTQPVNVAAGQPWHCGKTNRYLPAGITGWLADNWKNTPEII
ncbi:MAG: carboxyltransferase domain-containing protein [Bacteroidota bacterium]